MGRELRRVPMDFDWPLKKVWHGYLNPHYRKCPKCDNGQTIAGRYLDTIVHLIMIAGQDSLKGTKHPWLNTGLIPDEPPSSDMVELVSGLAGKDPDPFLGFDSGAQWHATKKLIEAAGLDPDKWGMCPHCQGEALDPAAKDSYEAWQEFEPPEGCGYQLWETTSEGSPISPVFATLDELCEWATQNATTFAGHKATAAEWKKMLDDNFVYHQEGGNIFL